MSNLLKSKTFQVGGLVIAMAFAVAMMLSVVSTANAQTTTTTTTVVASGFTYSGVMKAGMSGPGISTLQAALNEVNMGTTIVVDGKFGPATHAAVVKFQMSKGLVADGIVGPKTGAALTAATLAVITIPSGPYPAGCTSNGGFSTTTGMSCAVSFSLPAGCTSTSGYSPTTGTKCDSGSSTTLPAGCTSTTGYSTTTGAKCDGGSSPSAPSGPLAGGAGSIESADFISSINNEEVGEGQDDVEVLGLEIEADDNSDLRLLSVRVVFANEHDHDAASSDDFDDYATEVSVWFNGDKVGSADVEDFSENNDIWSKTISLDSSAVIRAGETENLVIAVSAVNNIDSTDEEETWTAQVQSLRYEDAQGAIISDSTTGAIGSANTAVEERDFSFESFSTAQDIEMKVSLSDDDDVNEAHVIEVSTTTETDGVEVLSFDVEAEGDSDLWLDKVVVDFTTSEDDLNDVISRACLFADGDELDCVNVTSEDATDVPVTWDDLDYTIDAGDTITFTVEVDFEAIDASFVEGTTLLAEITDTETDLWTVEDESGDDLADAEKTGTAVGEAHGAYSVGIMARFVSSSATVQKSGIATVHDQGTFTVVFDVTAFGSDIFIDRTAIADEAGGATYQNIVVNGAVGTGVITSSADTAANETYKVPEDQTKRFTVTMQAPAADGGGFADAALESILYALTAVDGDLLYTFNMGDYKTDSVFLSDN